MPALPDPALFAITRTGTPWRGEDDWGEGRFGAPRGDRVHRGVDVAVSPGDEILAPMEADIVREAKPYDDDPVLSGLLLRGRGPWSGWEIKIFYLEGPNAGHVFPGEPIGRAQDLSSRYPGITNHVHVEVRREGRLVDPTPLLQGGGSC